ncbi:ubiquinol-cytochrome c reductase cytochrome b subunit [Plantactinospora sp. KLBMP9567]|uniref:cytochrome bc1 complex cytochrome b subunit n=1 Tax=Plantactinospora sp. KLBMP9567 TaxID=3085900 RepID=UPI002982A8DC|nr:ubiquinol-cytochrome c reductase cytochrome b subunit [Plantactinospora sp. KLBMP9567]MDW5329656.1 ubiquinol-cytochrome c reductase cytochrome b subunit [Plantactinospora sp. KLBMP9567]
MITRWLLRRLARTVDDRLRTAPVLRKALAKVFPDHWSFMLGEIALYSFVVLVLTGVFLTLFFEPSTAETVYTGSYEPLDGSRTSSAYASTVRLSFDIRAGLLMRQTHHWAALLFVGAIVLHLLRIFFTGAFRKPRELNWAIGVTMLALALFNGFTGYSIPDDLLSGTGLRILYSVTQSIPLVGEWLVFLAFGGEFPTEQMVPRMFVAHVLLVPAVLAALIAAHLGIVIRQKHSQFPGPGRTENNVVGSRFWPSYTLRTLALFAWVLAVTFALGGLAQINPVWIYGPFEPAQVTSPAQPDWYIAWGDGVLRLFPAVEFRVFGHLVPSPFLPGVLFGGLTFLGLYLWPFLERRHGGDRLSHQLLDPPRAHPARLGVGVGVLALFTVLLAAAADDIIAKILKVPVLDVLSILRVLALALPVPVGVVAYLVARALPAGGDRERGELSRAGVPQVRRSGGVGSRTDKAATCEKLRSSPETVKSAGHVGLDDETRRAEPVGGGARIELWQEQSGTWRWRFRDGKLSLVGNQAHLSRPEAEQAAETAYGNLPVLQVEAPGRLVAAAIGAAERAGRAVGRTSGFLALAVFTYWRNRRSRRG